MKATIQKVTLKRIDEIWKKHKPQGLGFSDTDVIIVNLKTEHGKEYAQDFYCRLKGDGTLGHSITKASERRQIELQNFIKKYISPEEQYNIRNSIDKWKGKEVEVKIVKGGLIIV